MENTKKSNRGRKSWYNEIVKPHLDKIVEWAAAGMTDADIMKNLGIGRTAEKGVLFVCKPERVIYIDIYNNQQGALTGCLF